MENDLGPDWLDERWRRPDRGGFGRTVRSSASTLPPSQDPQPDGGGAAVGGAPVKAQFFHLTSAAESHSTVIMGTRGHWVHVDQVLHMKCMCVGPACMTDRM